MRELPNGAGLLDTARHVVRKELLAALPAGQRHLALMVANAMSIAQRQLERGEDGQRREQAALATLLGIPAAPRGALLVMSRELARAIRAGQADPGSAMHAPVAAFLLDVGRTRLEESNPKYLENQP
ncbi:MAG: DUF6285 domain-containing protein [Pseudomonadota bacterium]